MTGALKEQNRLFPTWPCVLLAADPWRFCITGETRTESAFWSSGGSREEPARGGDAINRGWTRRWALGRRGSAGRQPLAIGTPSCSITELHLQPLLRASGLHQSRRSL